MVKFLHLADVHLDAVVHGRTEALRSRLRAAARAAFERAVDCALREKVQAVLIAGDLFDDERLSFHAEAFLLEQLRRLEAVGIPCIYVTGNDDPGGRRFRASGIAWPSNLDCIHERELTCIVLTKPDGDPLAYVIGSGHEAARERDNLAAAFPPPEEDVPHIGLLHATVEGADGHDEHAWVAPCTTDDLARTGYAYWALGHVHRRQQVGELPAWYAGCLQGRGPAEAGPQGGLLVTLEAGAPPEVAFRPFAPLQWATLTLDDLAGCTTRPALEQHVRQHFEAYAAAHDAGAEADWLVQVTLTGACPMADLVHDAEQAADVEQALAKALGVVDVELRPHRLTRPAALDEHREQPHLLGEVLSLLDEVRDNPALLAELAPEPLAATAEDRQAYLRSLLADLDREAAALLLADR